MNKNHHLFERSGKWYFQYRGVKKSLKTSSITEARDLRDQLMKELDYHGVDLLKKQRTQKVFGEVALEWWERKKTEGCRKETLRNYKSMLNSKLLKAPFVDKVISEIEDYEIEDWYLNLFKQSSGAINTYLTALSGIFKFALKRHYVERNPMTTVKRPKYKKREIDPFTMDEVWAILDATPEHYKTFLTTKIFTGARISEVCGLKWKDVDLVNDVIKIRRSLLNGVEGATKNENSVRDITLYPIVKDAILKQREHSMGKSEWVFVDTKGNPINNNNFLARWRDILGKAGVRYRCFEMTRHTFITLALDAGERDIYVAKHCGHKDTRMIQLHYQGFIKYESDGQKFSSLVEPTPNLPHSSEASAK